MVARGEGGPGRRISRQRIRLGLDGHNRFTGSQRRTRRMLLQGVLRTRGPAGLRLIKRNLEGACLAERNVCLTGSRRRTRRMLLLGGYGRGALRASG